MRVHGIACHDAMAWPIRILHHSTCTMGLLGCWGWSWIAVQHTDRLVQTCRRGERYCRVESGALKCVQIFYLCMLCHVSCDVEQAILVAAVTPMPTNTSHSPAHRKFDHQLHFHCTLKSGVTTLETKTRKTEMCERAIQSMHFQDVIQLSMVGLWW